MPPKRAAGIKEGGVEEEGGIKGGIKEEEGVKGGIKEGGIKGGVNGTKARRAVDMDRRRMRNKLSAKKSRESRRMEMENLRMHFKVANETIRHMMGTIEELRARVGGIVAPHWSSSQPFEGGVVEALYTDVSYDVPRANDDLYLESV